MTVDLHTAQIQGFFDGPVDHLFALTVLADHINAPTATTTSPSSPRTRVVSDSPRSGPTTRRPTDRVHPQDPRPVRPNEAVANRVVGEVEGRLCVVIDDMIDTGGTIAKAAEALMEEGARDVVVAATHGMLSGPGRGAAAEVRAREVVVTDTLPIPEEKRFPKLTVLPIAPLLARAIQEVFEDGSVTSLFDGNA